MLFSSWWMRWFGGDVGGVAVGGLTAAAYDVTYSLEPNFKIGIINVLSPTDRGPSMLVQILRQSTGTLAVTIENYESIMKTSKLIDVEGCNFTKY